jgi:tetratricopeptide (TPR) repeat protein
MRKLIFILAFLASVNSTIAIAGEKLVDLVKKIKPCVVLVETFDKDNHPLGQGSGFFVDNKGHIVTNNHVLEGAYRATVKTSSGKEYSVEGIVAKNIEADIVKLVVNISDANITFLNLNTKVPSEGEDIIVIGNPLGLESTVSTGIVSAVRDIPVFGKILQITAPVSPGSSGSPVIDSKGEVIGIATFIATKGQNLNFAIPSDKIIALKEIVKTPIAGQYTSLSADANDVQKLVFKGSIEILQENWSAALTYFQKAKEANPQNADVWLYLGFAYGKLDRRQEALETFKQAIRIKPDYAEAHCGLGIAYGKLDRWQEALEAYKQAIRIKPDYAVAHYSLGLAYAHLDRWQEAIEACKQAIRIKPDYAEAHTVLGNVYFLKGDKGSALEEYKILKTLDAERANELFNLIYK